MLLAKARFFGSLKSAFLTKVHFVFFKTAPSIMNRTVLSLSNFFLVPPDLGKGSEAVLCWGGGTPAGGARRQIGASACLGNHPIRPSLPSLLLSNLFLLLIFYNFSFQPLAFPQSPSQNASSPPTKDSFCSQEAVIKNPRCESQTICVEYELSGCEHSVYKEYADCSFPCESSGGKYASAQHCFPLGTLQCETRITESSLKIDSEYEECLERLAYTIRDLNRYSLSLSQLARCWKALKDSSLDEFDKEKICKEEGGYDCRAEVIREKGIQECQRSILDGAKSQKREYSNYNKEMKNRILRCEKLYSEWQKQIKKDRLQSQKVTLSSKAPSTSKPSNLENSEALSQTPEWAKPTKETLSISVSTGLYRELKKLADRKHSSVEEYIEKALEKQVEETNKQ